MTSVQSKVLLGILLASINKYWGFDSSAKLQWLVSFSALNLFNKIFSASKVKLMVSSWIVNTENKNQLKWFSNKRISDCTLIHFAYDFNEKNETNLPISCEQKHTVSLN